MGAERPGLVEIVLAMVDARPDPATERFDAELAAAVADGRLDPTTARTLRWWQREAVRGTRGYLADALPPVLDALAVAAAGSHSSVAEAAAAWSRAGATDENAPVNAPPTPPPVVPPAGATAASHVSQQPSRSVPRRPADLSERRREVVVGLISEEAVTGSTLNGTRSNHPEGNR